MNKPEQLAEEKASTKFRKKPVVIEAIQWDGKLETLAEIVLFVLPRRAVMPLESSNGKEAAKLYIETLEGDMKAEVKDWIIKGVQGECYPCKPDIFDKTYEAATPLSAGEEITVKELPELATDFNNILARYQDNLPSEVKVKWNELFAPALKMKQQDAGFTLDDMRKCFEAAQEHTSRKSDEYFTPAYRTFDDYLKQIQSEKKT